MAKVSLSSPMVKKGPGLGKWQNKIDIAKHSNKSTADRDKYRS